MFELPEYVVLSRQMNERLPGKVIADGCLGNSPHKFVWYNHTHEEFAQLAQGKTVGKAYARGRWLFLPLEPGYVFVLGECGGKVLYHEPGASLPAKYHLLIHFSDGSALSAMTQMWGAMELYIQGQEKERMYIRDMRTTPLDPEFTFAYFNSLIESLIPGEKRSAKSLLTQDQLIPGLGNSIAQDILYQARLHPKHLIKELTPAQRQALYNAILSVTHEIIDEGGRYDETDLYNQPGGYVRRMDKESAGKMCPQCSDTIQKIQYLGGACYFCPTCQV